MCFLPGPPCPRLAAFVRCSAHNMPTGMAVCAQGFKRVEAQAGVHKATAQEGLADMSAALDRALEARALEVGSSSSMWRGCGPVVQTPLHCAGLASAPGPSSKGCCSPCRALIPPATTFQPYPVQSKTFKS